MGFMYQDILLRARFFSEGFKCLIVALFGSPKLICFKPFLFMAVRLVTGGQDIWL